MREIILTAEGVSAGERLDAFISSKIENLSRNSVAILIKDGKVLLNGIEAKKSAIVVETDVIKVLMEPPKSLGVVAQPMALEIIYEDEHLLVVNKEKGMVVHPAPGNESGTLVNALLSHCGESLSGINGVIRPGIVHRLDKDTSGLLVVAKTDIAHKSLASQLANRSLKRYYEAVVFGRMPRENGELEQPIGRNPKDRKKMAIVEGGKAAQTLYHTVAVYVAGGTGYSHISLELITGRTHQIRVHCSNIGHAVIGDKLYGNHARDVKLFPNLVGQCLHARTIRFVHPSTGETLELTSALPTYFVQVLTALSAYDIII